MEYPKTYQVPKASHPWRRYKNKVQEPEVKKEPEKQIKPVRIFLTEIVESWESVEIVTTAFGREDRFYLTELPQPKVAAWLAGMLKRHYEI